ncbi:hypothetical protein C8J35_107194 [Rhizobium sp. PP-F2F-G38]|uniref:Uncharacterized protein n=1 Tax=Ferranicluibacter rubi TaxID=2715133 RepID=A0AA43ZDB1_9HYPH|nr:hypothetical protein [Ferranicluibacter rubi]PYE32606.1 hypothetical protein C8J37_107193 [Rhizobium sp. PP-WC-1G-195]PYE96035.1 hypothetical protein C8J35_107194 [Rhizobium sp. PP-F2F-G38]TCP88360.1 hypothetical protein C8J31_103213 [Rhizobium sp. PP-CC-2G-626]TCQ22975.1 hypothetical protein C8J33_105194 [Rhizobium sp. PP-CC-3G-465]NHT75715.1 hypothetical protein [Ferranicluibacter rubi]
MRKTQPNFVVEYKGGRRQKSSPKTSIWGAVDFTKLTSEIEYDLPPEVRSDVADINNGGGQHPAEHHMPNKDLVAADVEIGGRPASLAEPSLTSDVGGERRGRILEAVHTQSEEIASPASEHRVLEHGSDGEPRPEDHQHGPMFVSRDGSEPALSAEPVSRRQLAALESENRELKRLLVERLTEENHCLEKMLERFLD